MSDTVTAPPASVSASANAAAGLPAMPVAQVAAVNAVVAQARNAPQLMAGLEVVAPVLAERLTTEAASIHAAPWGGAVIAAMAYAVSYLGLGWSQDFDAIVVGGGYMLGSYLVPFLLTLTKKV